MKEPLFACWLQDRPESGCAPGYLIRRGDAPPLCGEMNVTTQNPRRAHLATQRFWTAYIDQFAATPGEWNGEVRLVREEDLP